MLRRLNRALSQGLNRRVQSRKCNPTRLKQCRIRPKLHPILSRRRRRIRPVAAKGRKSAANLSTRKARRTSLPAGFVFAEARQRRRRITWARYQA
jgi:hypothetical protein